jgi:hypothetical protein
VYNKNTEIMKNIFVILFLFLSGFACFSQSFPAGTNAIHKDSSIIVSWAVSAVVERGYINIADTAFTYTEGGVTSNKAWFGSPDNAAGVADGQFVSLGDSGNIVLQFGKPVFNGPGQDFAVFENAIFSPPTQFVTAFVELAFVEVSSNGTDYERFPAVSSCQFTDQIGTFEATELNQFENLAGIYPVFYGVPFDLEEIPGILVDKNNITHIRIIDAIGNINPQFASYDSEGNIINDAWPTPFATCGFDLDAVGIINSAQNIETQKPCKYSVFPNPVKDVLNIPGDKDVKLVISDNSGRIIMSKQISVSDSQTDISKLPAGIYIIKIDDYQNIYTQKLIVID